MTDSETSGFKQLQLSDGSYRLSLKGRMILLLTLEDDTVTQLQVIPEGHELAQSSDLTEDVRQEVKDFYEEHQSLKEQIALMQEVEEVDLIHLKSASVCEYARRMDLSLEHQNNAAEVSLLAQRRIGELLELYSPHGGDRRSQERDRSLKLSELGISKDRSARCRRLSRIPAGEFASHVATVKKRGELLSMAGTLRTFS